MIGLLCRHDSPARRYNTLDTPHPFAYNKRMKVIHSLLISTMLAAPSLYARDAAAAERAGAESSGVVQAADIDSIFRELVDEAQVINRLLNEVTDRESADRIVPELKSRLQHLRVGLSGLERYSFSREQDAEALKSHMTSLTHISQRNLADMQRLAGVNAYGSEALMGIFDLYKINTLKAEGLDADDLPQTMLYHELEDALEAALPLLRRIQSEETATESLPGLRAVLSKIESAHRRLVLLAPPHTNEQKEALRPVRENLHRLSLQLKEEISRLQAAKCYSCAALDALLPHLLSPAAS